MNDLFRQIRKGALITTHQFLMFILNLLFTQKEIERAKEEMKREIEL